MRAMRRKRGAPSEELFELQLEVARRLATVARITASSCQSPERDENSFVPLALSLRCGASLSLNDGLQCVQYEACHRHAALRGDDPETSPHLQGHAEVECHKARHL